MIMSKKFSLLMLVLLSGCSSLKESSVYQSRKPYYRVQVGLGKGGVTENTDMTVVPNAGVDAFTGSTRTSFNIGGRVVIPQKRNAVETGIDYLQNNQTFNYNDDSNAYVGERNIKTMQLMVPITYNIPLFKRIKPQGLFQIKFGYLCQFTFFNIYDSGYRLPNYRTKVFSNGFTLGFSTNLLRFENGANLGIFFEGYRGTQIFKDFYNKTEYQMPGTSFMKYGFIYEF